MFAAQPTEHLPRRLGAAGLHVREALLNAWRKSLYSHDRHPPFWP
jgi:hypothetical protein